MNRVRVKICGVRSLEEARVAIEAGADALGFNFWPRSPRYITPEAAREMIRGLAPLVSFVGVFVNEDAGRIAEIVSNVGLSAVQLHGDESPQFCASLDSIPIIKAFRVGEDFDPGLIKHFSASAVLLDTKIKGSFGGTGQKFDWSVATRAKQLARIILAGGLTIDNVTEAITSVTPFAIDVCSGVEAEPGRKDLEKLRAFMAVAAEANAAIASNKESDR